MAISKYGYQFPDGTTPVTMELHAFKEGRDSEQGGLGKYQHFMNATDLIWNNPAMPATRNFIWSPWAEDMLYEACENQYVAVAGCASSGKSDTFALWGIVNYLASPTDTLVMMTSTTLREARRRIWKSVMDLWNAQPGLPGKVVASLGMIKGLDKSGRFSESTGICLVPAERKKEKDAIGKLVGIKQQNVFMVADELPEIPQSLVHACFTNLANNPNFHMVGLGNPSSHYDAFGVMAEPKAGWTSVSENDYSWETSRGICIRFNAENNPNITEPGNKYPWMPTQKTIDEAANDYGKNSLLYYRMYKGFWCPDGIANGVYSEADLIKADAVSNANFTEDPTRVASLDPSFTSGGDLCMAYFGRCGRAGDVDTINFDETVTLKEDINNKEVPRSHQIARAFRDECIKRKIEPYYAACDSTGGGGPFLDVLHNEWSRDVLAVCFAGKASDRPVSASDPKPGHERYVNRMSELWFQGNELLRSGQMKGVDHDLSREMVSRMYDTKGTEARIVVESKVEYKARVGRSPDRADSAFVMVDLCRQRLGLMGGERFTVNKGRQEKWGNQMRKVDHLNNSHHAHLEAE